MKSKVRAALFAAVFSIVAGGVSGCSSDDVVIDLSGAGPYDLEVGPCVQLAASSQLRDEDDGRVRTMVVRVGSADQRIDDGFSYDVTGQTEVHADKTVVYEWSCTSHVDGSAGQLEARITDFARK